MAGLPTDVAAMRARLVAPARCLDQAELLRAFDLPVALLQDAEALERCAAELVEDVAGDGTRYAEIRWAPSLHTREGLALSRGHRGRGSRSRQGGRCERHRCPAHRGGPSDPRAGDGRGGGAGGRGGAAQRTHRLRPGRPRAPGTRPARLRRRLRPRPPGRPGHHLPRRRVGRRGPGACGARDRPVAHRPRRAGGRRRRRSWPSCGRAT